MLVPSLGNWSTRLFPSKLMCPGILQRFPSTCHRFWYYYFGFQKRIASSFDCGSLADLYIAFISACSILESLSWLWESMCFISFEYIPNIGLYIFHKKSVCQPFSQCALWSWQLPLLLLSGHVMTRPWHTCLLLWQTNFCANLNLSTTCVRCGSVLGLHLI